MYSCSELYSVHEKKIVDISLQLNTARLATIEQNRNILSSIIETIILIGRQEISLRGHRDSGPILSEVSNHNDGNFRALLRFRVDSGDNTLNDHLLRVEAMPSNKSKKKKLNPPNQSSGLSTPLTELSSFVVNFDLRTAMATYNFIIN